MYTISVFGIGLGAVHHALNSQDEEKIEESGQCIHNAAQTSHQMK